MTSEQVEPNWPNRYGTDDVIGAANEITPNKVLSATQLIKIGERIPLGRILDENSPTQMWRYWKHHMTLESILPQNYSGENQQSYVEEAVSGALHSGTHIDALGHIGIGNFAYNGAKYSDIATGQGLLKLGIESIPPLITRGVLLNIAKLKGVTSLDGTYCITAEDLDNAQKQAGVEVSSGDCVLLHTGWGTYWHSDPAKYSSSEPGIALGAAKWLSERRVAVVGADNWAVELVPGLKEEGSFPVHQHLIALYGQYILENVATEELAARNISEFCFMLAAARLKGASGVPVAPVAII
jgi:hypothetical protein